MKVNLERMLDAFDDFGKQVRKDGPCAPLTGIIGSFTNLDDRRDILFRFTGYQRNSLSSSSISKPSGEPYHTVKGQLRGYLGGKFAAVLSRFIREYARTNPEEAYLFAAAALTRQNFGHLGRSLETSAKSLPLNLKRALGYARGQYAKADPRGAFEVGSGLVERKFYGKSEYSHTEERWSQSNHPVLREEPVYNDVTVSKRMAYDKSLMRLAKKYLSQ